MNVKKNYYSTQGFQTSFKLPYTRNNGGIVGRLSLMIRMNDDEVYGLQ